MRGLIKQETDMHMISAYAEMLEGSLKHPQEQQWYAVWGIRLKSGEWVGDLCYKGGPINGAVEIGYGIVEAHQGKGYATEAVSASIDWAFAQQGVYVVTAETEPDNHRSIHVLEKLGFTQKGEGIEGPRFEKEKPAVSWLAIYMMMGMAIGIAFGAPSGNTAATLSIGMGAGLALGVVLDHQENAQRKKAREAREATQPVPSEEAPKP